MSELLALVATLVVLFTGVGAGASAGCDLLEGAAKAMGATKSLYADYKTKLDELDREEKKLFRYLPSDKNRYKDALKGTLSYLNVYQHLTDDLKELFESELGLLREWEQKHKVVAKLFAAGVENPAAHGLEKADELRATLKPLKLASDDLYSLEKYFKKKKEEGASSEDKKVMKLVLFVLEDIAKVVRRFEDVQIVSVEYPVWFDSIEDTFEKKYNELMVQVKELATKANAKFKLKEVDSVKEGHSEYLEAVSLTTKYKEMLMWKSLIGGWRSVWKTMRRLREQFSQTDVSAKMITYDSKIGKIVIDFLLAKKQLVNPVLDAWKEWETQLKEIIKELKETQGGWFHVDEDTSALTMENAKAQLKHPIAQMQWWYDELCKKVYCRYVWKNYSEKAKVRELDADIPSSIVGLLRHLLKEALFPSLASIKRTASMNSLKKDSEAQKKGDGATPKLTRRSSENQKEILRKSGKVIHFEKPAKKEEKPDKKEEKTTDAAVEEVPFLDAQEEFEANEPQPSGEMDNKRRDKSRSHQRSSAEERDGGRSGGRSSRRDKERRDRNRSPSRDAGRSSSRSGSRGRSSSRSRSSSGGREKEEKRHHRSRSTGSSRDRSRSAERSGSRSSSRSRSRSRSSSRNGSGSRNGGSGSRSRSGSRSGSRSASGGGHREVKRSSRAGNSDHDKRKGKSQASKDKHRRDDRKESRGSRHGKDKAEEKRDRERHGKSSRHRRGSDDNDDIKRGGGRHKKRDSDRRRHK